MTDNEWANFQRQARRSREDRLALIAMIVLSGVLLALSAALGAG